MHRHWQPTLAVAFVPLAIILLASTAYAQRIFVNGVDVTDAGLARQELEEVERVLFDAENNIHVVAPAYELRVEDPSGGPGRDADAMAFLLGGEHFLVTVPTPGGRIGQEMVVFINGHRVQAIRADDPQIVRNISAYLKLGQNRVRIIARPEPGAQRSGSDEDRIEVVIGRGRRLEGSVRLDRTLVSFTRTSAEHGEAAQEFEFVLRASPQLEFVGDD